MINQPQPLSLEAHPPPRGNPRSWLVEPSSNRKAPDSPAPAQSGSDSQGWKRNWLWGSVFGPRMMGPFSSNFSTHSIMVIFISIIISFIITRTKVDQCRNRWTNFCLLGFPKSLTMTKVFFRDLTGQLKKQVKKHLTHGGSFISSAKYCIFMPLLAEYYILAWTVVRFF